MNKIRRFTTASVVVAFALLALACGGIQQAAQRSQRTNDLKQIGLAYDIYCTEKGKGPANSDDLLPFVENSTLLMQKTKGEYTIIWGVDLTDKKQFTTTGTSETILGYEASAPTSGGLVLFCDTSVKQLTAAEFKSKTLAKPKGK
jgi:hypothetical protein